MSENTQPMKVKYVVERKSWFYGFFQALLAVVIGGVVTSIFSAMIFFGVLGAVVSAGEVPAAITDHSVLCINLDATVEERAENNPFEKEGGWSNPAVESEATATQKVKYIAAIAEANYIPFAPHNPSGPIANAATLQLAACCPNFCILEIMYSDVDWRKDVTDENLVYENGRIKIGDKPGLGIELNEEECMRHPYVEHTLRHYTGALTDIRPAKTEFYF